MTEKGNQEKKKLFGLFTFPSNKRHTIIFALVIGCIGVLLLFFRPNASTLENALTNPPKPKVSVENKTDEVVAEPTLGQSQPDLFSVIETQYEEELKVVLEQVQGISDVDVIVNLDASSKIIVEKDRSSNIKTTSETDREGGKRTIDEQSFDEKVAYIDGDEGKEPLILTTEKPTVRGVLIVCKGVNSIALKKEIVVAVTRVLDVPSHKVSVLPKKTK
ncbi:MAG: stage III sporulation protein AG [Bacilli bacterium]